MSGAGRDGADRAALRAALGDARVRDDEDTLARYGVDRSTLWRPAPLAVVFPESDEDVCQVVRLARQRRLALVASGGRTGLSGGAVAARGEVVVAMERMRHVIEFDPADRMLEVQAGMPTAVVQQQATERGLFYPVDFASAGSSQIGGNVATNAGGIKVIRYGMTRRQVTGLTVVDGRGELMRLNNGLLKNNSGPDLRHLFIGSEGCLGIVTSVTLQLQPPPAELAVLLLAVPDFAAILAVLEAARAALQLCAFEFFAHNALERVLARGGQGAPLARAPFYVLIEHELDTPRREAAALALFERAAASRQVLDGVISASIAQARSLWRLREDISETLARWSPWKSDLSVRLSRMRELIAGVEALVGAGGRDLEIVWYGHVGDGNLHLNILKPEAMTQQAFAARCEPLATRIAALVAACGGSISAEHGVGLLKKPHLAATLGEAGVQRLRDLKRVFDPDGVLNPGKLVDP